jgi:hypothetical protein
MRSAHFTILHHCSRYIRSGHAVGHLSARDDVDASSLETGGPAGFEDDPVDVDIWSKMQTVTDQRFQSAQANHMSLAKYIVPTLTHAAFSKTRKRVLIPAYVALIEEKKMKLGSKWLLQSDLDSLKVLVLQLESVGNAETDSNLAACWSALAALVIKINSIDVTGVAGVTLVPMTSEQIAQVTTYWDAAKSKAVDELDKLSKDPAAELVLKEFFHYAPSGSFDLSTISTKLDTGLKEVQANMVQIKKHIEQLDASNVKADRTGSLAHGLVGAANAGVGTTSELTFSAAWLSSPENNRIATLVHEASHGVADFGEKKIGGSKDISYVGFWAHNIIKDAPAIYNAPSYESAVLASLGSATGRKAAPIVLIDNAVQSGSAYAAKLETVLGKLDFFLTQAWWFATNIAHFAEACGEGKAKLDTEGVEDTAFYHACAKPYKTHGVPVATLIGLPMTVKESSKTYFTRMDIELHHLLVRHLGHFKNEVEAITTLSIKEAFTDVLEGSTLHLKQAQADESNEQIMERILQAAAVTCHFPASFYASSTTITAMVKALSGFKDAIESAVPKTGLND